MRCARAVTAPKIFTTKVSLCFLISLVQICKTEKFLEVTRSFRNAKPTNHATEQAYTIITNAYTIITNITNILAGNV